MKTVAEKESIFRDLNLIREDLDKLTKDDLGEYLSLEKKELRKLKKHELVEKIMDNIKDNELLQRKLYKDFEITFSLYPSVVEEMLGITKTERNRWRDERKLKVVGKGSFRKGSNYIEYDLFDVIQINSITPEMIESWREKHKEKVSESRKKGTQQAASTRKKNEEVQRKFYEEEWKPMLVKWRGTDGFLAATLQLAYWTVWVSRWAKEFQEKAYRAKSKQDEYEDKKEEFYELKNEAIQLLSCSPHTKLSFYEPDEPHRVGHIHLCEHHYQWWYEVRQGFDYPIWAYYVDNRKIINKCKGCQAEIIRDYYSLYYLEVGDEKLPDFTFSFHTPHPIGRDFFPTKSELPKATGHTEQEGMFRFGRSLFDEEKVIFREKEVRKHLEEAIVTFEMYLKHIREK
ncbi:hypothetical protein R3O67_31850 [Bacillus cereus]|uniref:hypothetical protein n=1 Tax=Bacillus cereus TaxID=1396 RepID=UPI00307A9641